MGLRDRMEAKSLSSPVYKARGRGNLLALLFFLQGRAKLLSACVPLDDGGKGQLFLRLSCSSSRAGWALVGTVAKMFPKVSVPVE